MTWFEAVPIALVTAAWLMGPGLAVGYLLGLRGIAAWGLAPIVSIALIASTAVGAEMLGIDWSVPIVLVVCAAALVVVGLGAVLLRRRAFFAPRPDPRGVTLAAAAGMVPVLVLGIATVVRAMGSPDAISQVFDTPFHYNALAHIRDTHQASSLTLSSLGNPDIPPAFYPAAWHDIGSLVMMSTGTDIPTASNMLAGSVTVLLWPLSCLLLVRQLFGPNRAALAVAGVLSIGFPAFPWDLMGFGVLWPNLLGMSMAPAGLAIVATLTGWAREDAIGRGRAWLMLVVGGVAAGFAHPNVLFSLIVLSVFFVGATLLRRALRLRREGRTVRGVGELVVFVGLLLVTWWWAATTPALANARGWIWRPFETPANAVGEVLLNSTNGHEALWLLSAVVIAGVVAARRRYPVLRLVVAGHLATAFLFVLAAAINRPDTQKFIGYWYNDSHRLAAMLPITAVPLAVGGVLLLASVVLEKVPALVPRPVPQPLSRLRPLRAATPIAIGVTLVLIGATGLLYPDDRAERIAVTYPRDERGQLVTNEMRTFYDEIADRLPEDAVVAGNPFDGSVMLWALEDRKVLYPHFLASNSDEQKYLARHLDDVASDPKVCRYARDLGVEYVLIGKRRARTAELYVGLADIAVSAGTPGLELLDSSGETRLYKIAACEDGGAGAPNATRPPR
jgi:hypothetical protein